MISVGLWQEHEKYTENLIRKAKKKRPIEIKRR
jgi:hypothetical protein